MYCLSSKSMVGEYAQSIGNPVARTFVIQWLQRLVQK